MRIAELRQTPFSLPYRRPLVLSGREISHCRGVLVEVVAEDGRSGVGEAALHPGAGAGELADLRTAILPAGGWLVGAPLSDTGALIERCRRIEDGRARAGLESALYDLAGRFQGRRLAEFLGVVRRERVAVNALLDERDPVASARAARRAVGEGFTCLKLKVGEQGAAELAERVAAIRAAAGSGVRIRLDANGVWRVSDAVAAIEGVAGFGIEYVEQPVADLAAMAAVRRAVDVPLAADELVVDPASVDAIASARAADVVIVKPAFVGLGAAASIARAAEECGLDVVVTSALDSSVGIAAALHLAATAGSAERASGLATASLLAADLVDSPLLPEGGELRLPREPGLGVQLDRGALERSRTADG